MFNSQSRRLAYTPPWTINKITKEENTRKIRTKQTFLPADINKNEQKTKNMSTIIDFCVFLIWEDSILRYCIIFQIAHIVLWLHIVHLCYCIISNQEEEVDVKEACHSNQRYNQLQNNFTIDVTEQSNTEISLVRLRQPGGYRIA